MNIETFKKNNRIFTLSQWSKEGFTKKQLKDQKDVVYYSTFLIKVGENNGKSHEQYEKIYIVNEELVGLFKEIKRTNRNNQNVDELANKIKGIIENTFIEFNKEQGERNV